MAENSLVPDVLKKDGEDLVICCADETRSVLKMHKLLLERHSEYFREILSLPLLSSTEKELIIFMKEVPFDDLKVIIEFIYGKRVVVARDQLESLKSSARLLQINELIAMLERKKSTFVDGTEEGDYQDFMSEDNSCSEDIALKFMVNADSNAVVNLQNIESNKNAFHRIWIQAINETDTEMNDLDHNDDKVAGELIDSAAEPKTVSSDSSSTFYDCIDSGDFEQTCKRKTTKDEEIIVEDAVVEVGTSSDSNDSVKTEPLSKDSPSSKSSINSTQTLRYSPSYVFLPHLKSSESLRFTYRPSLPQSSTDTTGRSLCSPPLLTRPFCSSIRVSKEPNLRQCPSSRLRQLLTSEVSRKNSKKAKRTNRYACGICGREMTWRQSVRVHIMQQHPEKEPKEWIRILEL